MNINPPVPVITSSSTATGTQGTAFSYQIAASNSPTTYAAAGLPAGLSVSTTTGLISGTPDCGWALDSDHQRHQQFRNRQRHPHANRYSGIASDHQR